MDDVEIHILDFVHQATAKSSTTDIRLGLEFDWIHRLHCLIPKGLNHTKIYTYKKTYGSPLPRNNW